MSRTDHTLNHKSLNPIFLDLELWRHNVTNLQCSCLESVTIMLQVMHKINCNSVIIESLTGLRKLNGQGIKMINLSFCT